MDFTIRIVGTMPLIMHNGRLADPLDPAAKALKRVTAKRRKTDEDHEMASRLEHAGSLYLDRDVGPYLPADNIWRTLYDAAKKSRHGPAVKEGVFITSNVNPLGYDGPRTAEELFADHRFVFRRTIVVTRNRVPRTRAIFPTWAVEADGTLDEVALNLSDLEAIAERAGLYVGLGDWRPKYGRFEATVGKR